MQELAKCDTDTKQANAVGKMAPLKLARHRVATNLPFVKNKKTNKKCNKAKCNKTRYAYITHSYTTVSKPIYSISVILTFHRGEIRGGNI